MRNATAHKTKLLHRISVPFLPVKLVELINRYETFVLYCLIGGVALSMDVGLFWLLDGLTELPVIVSNGLSIMTAMIYSFLMNAFFNFRTRSGLGKRFIMFGLVTFLGFLISSLILWTLSDLIGLNSVLAKILTLPVVFVVQFSLNSRFTFKKEEDHEDYLLESIR